MTSTTHTPYRSGQQPGRDGFAQLLRAEWTKLHTVRGWVIGLLVAVLISVLLGVLPALGSSNLCSTTPNSPGTYCHPNVPVGPGGEAVVDSFYFVRQPLTSSGSLTVRVTSLTGLIPPGNGRVEVGSGGPVNLRKGVEPWSKAGIIIAASTRPGAAYAAMMVTGGHGVRMQYDYVHDTAGLPGQASTAAPRWLRLTRSGDTITGYQSADGTRWTQVGTVSLAGLPSTVQAGLFATSPSYSVTTTSFGGATSIGGPTTATAVFDHLSKSGAWTGGGWTGDDIGGGQGPTPPSGGGGRYRQAGGTFTVTGSGDIAPAVQGTDSIGNPIEQSLTGVFGGLIAVIVVATLFITGEFRRGLIRVTLAASPRRGRVLAAKAIVIGLATFVLGLIACVIGVLVGPPLQRAHGFYIYPVSALTEVRVVAGTAALLALVAVLAVAAGTLLRRSVATVAVVIAVTIVPFLLTVASVLPVNTGDWLLRLTPASAFAVMQSVPQYPQVSNYCTPGMGCFPLAPWAGFTVLCGYVAVTMLAAVLLLRRRDA